MSPNLCLFSRLLARQRTRPELWQRSLKILVLVGLAVSAGRAVHQLIYWLSLHDFLTGVQVDWLEPSATSVIGVCLALNAAWVVNLLAVNTRWQRRLVSTFSWLALIGFTSVMLPLSQQLGELMIGSTSNFSFAEATLWGLVVLTTGLVWLSGLILVALLMTQTLGLSHLTHRIRHHLASFVGLQPSALAHVKVAEVA